MYDVPRLDELQDYVYAIRKHKGEWVLVKGRYKLFRNKIKFVGRRDEPKVLVEALFGKGFKTQQECRSYKRVDNLFNSKQEALDECTKRNNEIAEATCVNCGLMDKPVYHMEGNGYCADCLITTLVEKGLFFKDGYDITL